MQTFHFFFDNEATHVQAFADCSHVIAQKVPGQDKFRASEDLEKLRQGYSINAQAWLEVFQALQLNLWDPSSGIRVKATENFVMAQIVELQNRGHAVNCFFDWDRTLSQMEGLFMGSEEGFGGVLALLQKIFPELNINLLTLEGYAEFLMGSQKRFQDMQIFLRKLYDLNVNCYVLTNNTGCPRNALLFEELGFALRPGIGFTDIVCGASQNFEKKPALLSVDPSACL